MTKCKFAWIAMVAVMAGPAAKAELPSVKFLSAPLVSPADALTYYTSATTHSISVPGYSRAAEIMELANGLGRGQVTNEVFAQRAYEYVYNNLRIAHMFGMQKGPLGALVDQSGTAFDQASLFIDLLREAGITATYQLGTITLTGAQVSGWFGTTDATVLCRMLADGGIPGTVNGSGSSTCGISGTVSSATMLHVWVSALGNRYDPSFKVHSYKTGINLSTATLCGSNTSCSGTLSSVRTQARDAAFTSADTAAVTGSTNAVRGMSQSTLENRLTDWAMNLKARIDSQHPSSETADIVGGQSINAAAMSAPGTALPYGTPAATETWIEIPDRYRTTLRIQYDDINYTVYADETGGRRLRLGFAVFIDKHNPNTDPTTGSTALDRFTELRIESQELAESYRTTAGPGNDRLILEVNHPYVANSGTYLDDLIQSGIPLAPVLSWTIPGDDQEGPQPIANFSAAIVQGWGQSANAALAHYGALQTKEIFQGGAHVGRACAVTHPDLRGGDISQANWRSSIVVGSGGEQTGDPDQCLQSHRFSRIAQWLAQASRVSDLVGAVNSSTILHHHSIGAVVWNNAINVESSVSTISNLNVASDRRATNYSYAVVTSRLEGGVAEQISGAWDGESSVSSFVRANEKSLRMARFANVSGFNASNYYSPASSLYNALVNSHIVGYLNAGFSVITPEAATMYFNFPRIRIQRNFESGTISYPADTWEQLVHSGFLAVRPSSADPTVPDRIAFLTEGYGGLFKGAASEITGDDPAKATQDSVKLQDMSTKSRRFFGVDAGTGTMQLKPPPDLVTGAGKFPISLSFQRFYDSKSASLPQSSTVGESLDKLTGTMRTRFTTLFEYVGTLNHATDNSMIGGGWDHNWHISADIGSDPSQGLGEDSPIDAVGAITALNTLRALTRATPSFNETMSTVLVAHWLGSLLNDNTVVVKRPPSSSVFVKLPNGTYNPPNDSADLLVQSGTRVPRGNTTDGGQPAPTVQFDYRSVQFTLTDESGAQMFFDFGQTDVIPNDTLGAKQFKPTLWTFPTGVRVTFAYDIGKQPQCLTSVTSNTGRSLTFLNESPSYNSIKQGSINPEPFGQCYLKSVTDENGSIVTFTRPGAINALGNGGNEAYFGGMFRMPELRVTTPDGATVRYVYDDNITTSLTNPSAVTRLMRTVSSVYTPTDLTTTPYLSFTYDSLGRVKTFNDALLQQTNYFVGSYVGENLRRGESRDPVGATTTGFYNSFGKAIQIIDPLGGITSNVYDGRQRVSREIYPELNETRYTYDLRGNKLTETKQPKPGSALRVIVTTLGYGEAATVPVGSCTNVRLCNLTTSITDTLGRVTSYGYNGTTGLITSITRPTVTEGAPQVNFCYSAYNTTDTPITLVTGSVTKVSESENRVTRHEWGGPKFVPLSSTLDPGNSLTAACTDTTKANPLNLTTTYTFDNFGNVRNIDGPRIDVADVSTFYFDRMRRLTRADAPLNSVTRYTYDLDGQLRSTHRARVANPTDSAPTNPTPTDLNPAQWQTETRNYRATGELLDVTDPEGNQTHYAYDAAGRSRVVTDPDGRQVATVFDFAGQPLCAWRGGRDWTAASAPTTCVWDPSSYTGTGPVRYSASLYTPNGKQSSVLDANNNVTEFVYDRHDRLRYTFFPNPSTGARCTAPSGESGSVSPTCLGTAPNVPLYEEHWYSANGAAASAPCNATGKPCRKRLRSGQTIATTYDVLDRPRTRAATGQAVVTTGFNLASEPTSVSEPASGLNAAHSTSFTYDGAGRKGGETTNGRAVSYLYNDAGQRKRTTWPDGYYVTYDFDALGRMTYVRENGTFELAYYHYDILSRRQYLCLGGQSTSCLSGGGTNKTSYTYEADSDLDVLTQVLNGTVVTLDQGRNRSHQITSIAANTDFYLPGPVAVTDTAYTPNALNQYGRVGGQTSTYDTNGNLLTWFPIGGRHTYTYDSENRLITAAVNGSNTATIRYDYDALGRRSSKTVSGVATSYLLDGSEEIAEYDGSALLRRYVTGPGVDDRIARIEGTDDAVVRTYYHVNHQGSVMAITDAAGTVAARFAYDPYGSLGSESSTTGEAFRYTGRRFDPESGLYYYRARYYSPVLGRFLQTDPVGYKDDFNLYAYVGNDPANKTDPTGSTCEMTTDVHGNNVATSCKIDENRAALVEKMGGGDKGEQAVKKIEKAYLNAVNKLLKADKNTSVSLTIRRTDGKTVSASVSANAAGKSLANRKITYAPSDNRAMSTNESATAGAVGAGIATRDAILKTFRSEERAYELAWMHEGIHLPEVHKRLGSYNLWYPNHRDRFDLAAEDLYERTTPQ